MAQARALAPLIALALAIAAAGCIAPPGGETGDAPDTSTDPRTGGTMSASDSTDETSGLCTEDLPLSIGGGDDDDRFCATRTITIDGKISGFPALDVTLETFNGDVSIAESREGTWGLVATLKAEGSSAAAAEAALDEIVFTWAHEDARGHFVEAKAEHDGDADQVSAQVALTMPRSVVMTLVASTSNGDVRIDGGSTDGIALATSNGDIVAKTLATQASLTTSNGGIDATLTPSSDGRWMLTTSNGDVTLKVPEDAKYGYAIEGTTSNGEVEYGLRDGEKGPCPQGSEYYTPPCNHRTFETRGYGERDIQVSAVLTTSNGEVSASPS